MTRNRKRASVIAIAYLAFISLGIPDGLLGVAWPGIRNTFGLPINAIGILLLFGTAGYMSSSFFSGPLARKLGIGGLLGLSCAATGITLLVYALTPCWWLFVLFATVGGLGAGAIDAGINTYIAKYHGVRTMQWLHASFGVGISIGPFVMSAGIALTGVWQNGYLAVAGFQLLLALFFTVTRGRWNDSDSQGTAEESRHDLPAEAGIAESLRRFPVLVSMLLFFLYTGIETGIGLWAYTLLTESRDISPAAAGAVTGGYWISFTVGRVLAGWISSKLSALRLIAVSILTAIAGIVLVLLRLPAPFAVAGIAVTGFAIAPLFPALLSDTGRRVGMRHQANTIGMQISAAGFGAAAVPAAAGFLAGRFGLEAIPVFIFTDLLLLLAGVSLSHLSGRSSGMRS